MRPKMAQSGMAGVKNISQSRAYGEQTAGQPVRAKQFAETYKGEDSEARVGNRAYEKAAGGGTTKPSFWAQSGSGTPPDSAESTAGPPGASDDRRRPRQAALPARLLAGL